MPPRRPSAFFISSRDPTAKSTKLQRYISFDNQTQNRDPVFNPSPDKMEEGGFARDKKAIAFYDNTIVPLLKALELDNSLTFAYETPKNITANVTLFHKRAGTDEDTKFMTRILSILTDYRETTRCKTLVDWDREREAQNVQPFTNLDTRHIIHSIRNKRGIGALFDYQDIDVLAMIMLSQATGLTNFELQTLALAELKFFRTERNGTIFRHLGMQYCWKEGVGVGIYNKVIVAGTKLEQNAIVFVLLKLERMGVIKSAIQVYDGEELHLSDPDVYETAEVLRSKLERASSRAPDNRELQAFMQGKAEPPEALMNDLIEQEQQSPQNYRTPCWTVVDRDSQKLKRMSKSIGDGYISNFLCNKDNHHGYQCSPPNKIGIASARLYYCGQSFGLPHSPLYRADGYFVPGHEFFQGSLPTPEQFLSEQSSKKRTRWNLVASHLSTSLPAAQNKRRGGKINSNRKPKK